MATDDEASKSQVMMWLSVSPTSVVVSPVGCHNTLKMKKSVHTTSLSI